MTPQLATFLDGAVSGDQSIIGAHALVTPQTQIPAGSLVLGSPARVVRAFSAGERTRIRHRAEEHVTTAAYGLEHRIGAGEPIQTGGGRASWYGLEGAINRSSDGLRGYPRARSSLLPDGPGAPCRARTALCRATRHGPIGERYAAGDVRTRGDRRRRSGTRV